MGRTPGRLLYGLRAMPWLSQPLDTRCSARLLPIKPVAPAMTARNVMGFSLFIAERASSSPGAHSPACPVFASALVYRLTPPELALRTIILAAPAFMIGGDFLQNLSL